MDLLCSFDRFLAAQGHTFEGIAAGPEALALFAKQPLVPPLRLLYPKIPEYLRRSAADFALAGYGAAQGSADSDNSAPGQGLAPGWIVPYSLVLGESLLRLPPGWRERLVPTASAGQALHLHTPGRLDLLGLEFLAARRGLPADLSAMAPTDEELAVLAAWSHALDEG